MCKESEIKNIHIYEINELYIIYLCSVSLGMILWFHILCNDKKPKFLRYSIYLLTVLLPIPFVLASDYIMFERICTQGNFHDTGEMTIQKYLFVLSSIGWIIPGTYCLYKYT